LDIHILEHQCLSFFILLDILEVFLYLGSPFGNEVELLWTQCYFCQHWLVVIVVLVLNVHRSFNTYVEPFYPSIGRVHEGEEAKAGLDHQGLRHHVELHIDVVDLVERNEQEHLLIIGLKH
jgi:hypothetical protein